MNKQENFFDDFVPVEIVIKDETIVARGIIFMRKNNPYHINVGTQEYINELHEFNKKEHLTVSALGEEEHVLLAKNINSLESIRNQVRGLSEEDLQRYATFQEMDKESLKSFFPQKNKINSVLSRWSLLNRKNND